MGLVNNYIIKISWTEIGNMPLRIYRLNCREYKVSTGI